MTTQWHLLLPKRIALMLRPLRPLHHMMSKPLNMFEQDPYFNRDTFQAMTTREMQVPGGSKALPSLTMYSQNPLLEL
jgi:hypothetical protein